MQILLFCSNANTFQKYFNAFSNTFKYLKFYVLAYIYILNVKIVMQINCNANANAFEKYLICI